MPPFNQRLQHCVALWLIKSSKRLKEMMGNFLSKNVCISLEAGGGKGEGDEVRRSSGRVSLRRITIFRYIPMTWKLEEENFSAIFDSNVCNVGTQGRKSFSSRICDADVPLSTRIIPISYRPFFFKAATHARLSTRCKGFVTFEHDERCSSGTLMNSDRRCHVPKHCQTVDIYSPGDFFSFLDHYLS
ncbi:hypothetical protein ECG_08947 [Echinococcus granulosus]|uniref:Uncharacterized protein n=1 Tax=Echinococcus granulosus TaxID=6210 RepID=A0A068WSK1_ECHGR|nr:hypothetical protein ECG_08947 [Echinococcus granulosus]CDS21447.1 hypothetical protein EgrG_000186100 [Echinococcus granulosus]